MGWTSDLTSEEASAVARIWWVIATVGVLSFIAGIILVTEPSNSLATLAVIIGIFLLIDGIAELIRSFGHGVENRALAAIVGVLGIVVGILLIRHPFHGVAAVGLLIGIWLVAAGVIRLLRAILVPGHRLINLVVAAIELVVGIVICSDPHIGYNALAIIVGIWLIINGLFTLALGIAIRSAGKSGGGSGPTPLPAT
jgi:uncharacterized membrane protein HdeD (DUF308 family)